MVCVPGAAHPRAGGENSQRSSLLCFGAGSSPRGRGKHYQAFVAAMYGRLIPARAGKTGAAAVVRADPGAHPRAGGENFCPALNRRRTPGSSPRGRGKPAGRPPPGGGLRLIPARAGKTAQVQAHLCHLPAHPRAGGENQNASRLSAAWSGSSPRGRGKPALGLQFQGVPRLIPARAGKTQGKGTIADVYAAHPRAGGENQVFQLGINHSPGSSPRGRGKRRPAPPLILFLRLIPARAGKTPVVTVIRISSAAHPRAGGENDYFEVMDATRAGSSPRGRGKLDFLCRVGTAAGLIPARAGKTHPMEVSAGCTTAHPRAGGEN